MELVDEPNIKKLKAKDLSNQDKLKQLFDAGIKCAEITFHAAVNSVDKKPSNYYNEKSNNKERRAEISINPGASIVVLKQADDYFLTSTSNFITAHPKI